MYVYITPGSNFNHRTYCNKGCIKGIIDGKLQCSCGQEINIFNWNWLKEENCSNTVLSNNNKDILFHPIYSSGTAALRGNVPFQQNLHHYWEIKMISTLYGTDVMVGIGTSKIVLSDWNYRFCSALGIDSQSWGYSYHGIIQHDSMTRKYGSTYGLGCLVGVHLDMCKGTLEFHLNRKPLGIAFKDLKGRELYPMIISTAAQSAVRMTCAVSEEPTLQMKCLEFIVRNPKLHKIYKTIPGLTRYYDRKYFWIVPPEVSKYDADYHKRKAPIDDMSRMGSRKYRMKRIYHTFVDEEDISRLVYDFPEDKEERLHENSDAKEEMPSTSKQTCDNVTRKRSNSCDSDVDDCVDCPEHSVKRYCAKCKFRSAIEDEEFTDSSSSSNCDVIL